MNLLILIFLLSSGLYICFKWLMKWRGTYWQRKGVPLLDDVKAKKPESRLDHHLRLYKECKQRGLIHFGQYEIFNKPNYTPVDLELIKNILQKDFWHFPNHGIKTNEDSDPLSATLFNLNDEEWRQMRMKLTPTFTSGKMKMMFQTLVHCTEVLVEILNDFATKQEPVDIKEYLARCTTDIIGSCAFGINCNCLKNPESKFRKYGKKYLQTNRWKTYRNMMIKILPVSILKLIRLKSTDADVEAFFLNSVREVVEYRENFDVSRNDFLQLLIQLRNKGRVDGDEEAESEIQSTRGPTLTMNQVAAQCFIFFIGGFETSSTTMTFALYELATHPEIQDKLRREIQSVLKKHDNQFTYDAIMEMTYLDKLINETLRLHPPLPTTFRVCTKSYNVPGTDVILDPGTSLTIPIYAIHTDPEYYPDPQKFDPERFSEENKTARPACTFLSFGEGPRLCIGNRFGKLQSKVGLAAILNNFKISLHSKTRQPMQYDPKSFILVVDGDVWLTVTKVQ